MSNVFEDLSQSTSDTSVTTTEEIADSQMSNRSTPMPINRNANISNEENWGSTNATIRTAATTSNGISLCANRTEIFEGTKSHYTRLSDHLNDECEKMKQKLDNTLKKNEELRNNLVFLEKEKQKKIRDFREKFETQKKLHQLNVILDEELQNLATCLESSMHMEGDVVFMKCEEVKRYKYLNDRLQIFMNRLYNLHDKIMLKNRDLTKYVNTVEAKCDEKTRSTSAVHREMIQYSEKMRNLRKEIESTMKKRLELSPNIDQAKCKRNAVNVEIQQIEHEYRKLLKEIASRIVDLKSSKNELREKYEKEVAAMEKSISEYWSRVKSNSEEIEKFSLEIASTKGRISELENKQAELETMRCEKERSIVRLEEELKLKSDKLGKSSKELQEAKVYERSLTDEIKLLNAENERQAIEVQEILAKLENIRICQAYKEKITTLENNMKSMTEEMVQLKTALENEHCELECRRNINEKMKDEIIDVQERRKKIMEEHSKRKTNEVNSDEIIENRRILDALTKHKISMSATNESVKAKCEMLCSNILVSQVKQADIQINADQYRKENEILMDIIHTRNEEFNVLKKENEELDNSIWLLKKYVKDGTYVTQQELNKKLNALKEARRRDSEKLEALKQKLQNKSANKI